MSVYSRNPKYIQKALEINPNNSIYYFEKSKLGIDFDARLEAIDKAINIDKFIPFYFQKIRLLKRKNNQNGVIEVATELLDLDRLTHMERAKAYMKIAFAYEKLDNIKLACQNWIFVYNAKNWSGHNDAAKRNFKRLRCQYL